MKKLISILFYISLSFLPVGMLFKILHWPGGALMQTFGFLGILIYFTARTIKDIKHKRNDKLNITLQVLLVLSSFILHSKYSYFSYGNHIGLVLIPLFVITSLAYLIVGNKRYKKLTTASILYLIFTIPLFGIDFQKAPIHFIPESWYNRLNTIGNRKSNFVINFKTDEALQLRRKGIQLIESKLYTKAILIYNEALNIEPDNALLYFDLSQCYANLNDLEYAISFLDSAIMFNNRIDEFYSNRGLYYYKIKKNQEAINDFKSAISIDSICDVYYYNLSLALYSTTNFEEAYKALKKAESLGFNYSDNLTRKIKKNYE